MRSISLKLSNVNEVETIYDHNLYTIHKNLKNDLRVIFDLDDESSQSTTQPIAK